ncbi:Protein of unknown function- DUF547 [Striga hermonthica]|uniref:DUF547 domain-containing protein n=1 Tax=Striga hermonthica TaxID=68872 RepID=A0A9N7RKD0_STRHE|nr:Protein of unknown function- DUF547 [Striga hermonthica]
MMSHSQQQRKLAKNEIDTETPFCESSFSSSSPSSSSHSSSFNSLANLLTTPTVQIGYDKRHHVNHRDRKLNGSSCFSAYSKSWGKLKHGFGSLSHMAGQNNESSSLNVLTAFRKKRVTGQQKEELEREVSVLHKMLAHEQKVHQYLEQLHERKDGSALAIPDFLPQNMKDIVSELAMVENEITQLESQIKQLKTEVKQEKEVNMEKKYKEWGRGTLKNRLESSPQPLQHPNRKTNEKVVTYESKALHFINKAIKGEYHTTDFSGFSNNHNEEGGRFRDRLAKRSSTLKSPSPFRESRHPTPRVPPKVLSTPLHTEEENIQRLSPNKLSENIMKCLVFIYVRLLRTSRVMELEKSGPVARSMNFSLSFRAETSSTSKTNPMFQKDSRQQDPYGIFDSEESLPRDIGPYKNLIRFTSSSMDMKCIQSSSSVPLFQKLKVLMDGLQKVDLRFLSHQQKLAFWINMYNACIMHGYLQYGVPSVFSPENLVALINKATLNIAGNTINAQAIEHFILRKPKDKLVKEILGKDDRDSKKMIVHELYGVESPDPNIIFALCCGTRSSPAVKVYTADGVAAELEKSKLDYLQAAIMVTSSKKIAVPELVLKNMNDFAADKESLTEWICHQLPASCSLRKSIVDCFRGPHAAGKASSAIVDKMPYEFEFQYLLPT